MPTTARKPVALIIGASRGIGRQIALTLAAQDYTVIVAAKSTSDPDAITPFPPNPHSRDSTISTVAREIALAGGTAHAAQVDTRDAPSVTALIETTIATHGLDALVYNAGAIWWGSVARTPYARYALMRSVNVDGFYAALAAALPHFNARRAGRIVAVCPPIYARFFRGKAAYAAGKVGMSVLVKGLAVDFEREGMGGRAVTGLWPATAIQSGATRDAQYVDEMRSAEVFADAVLAILRAPVADVNGLLALDEDFLREHEGVVDFSRYSLVLGATPRRIMPAVLPDLRVAEEADEGRRMDSTEMRRAKAAKL